MKRKTKVILGVFAALAIMGGIGSSFESVEEAQQSQAAEQKDEAEAENNAVDKKDEAAKSKNDGNIFSEAEIKYLERASAYIEDIYKQSSEVTAVFNSQTKDENWAEDTKAIAKNIIENGNILRNLEYDDDAKTLGDLIQLFGYTVAHSYENYIEGIETSDKEKLMDWKLSLDEASGYNNEFRFYLQNGSTVSEQLNEDIYALENDNFDIAGVTYGFSNASIMLKIDYSSNKDELRENCFRLTSEVLKMLSEKEGYNYLNVSIDIQSSLPEGEFKAMQTSFSSQTRSKLNFDELSIYEIPDIADSYNEKLL